MFLFDWTKIYIESDGNIVETVRILRMLVERQIPRNRKDPIYGYSQKNFSGRSFLLHPDVLLYHSYKYTYREVAQYIALAALRSYADYISNQKITLDLVFMPGDQGLSIIENNRLLYLEDDQVHFLYEEVNNMEIH